MQKEISFDILDYRKIEEYIQELNDEYEKEHFDGLQVYNLNDEKED